MVDNRYNGRPLLAFLDAYVLWCIGKLDAELGNRLEQLTPHLQETFGASGTWQELVERAMSFTAETREQVKSVWARNLAMAQQRGEELDPSAFARIVVDAGFAPKPIQPDQP